jgi:hypothetical protein
MPVVGEAGNRITWNHFFFVSRTGLPACRRAEGATGKKEPGMKGVLRGFPFF